jgi:integrase
MRPIEISDLLKKDISLDKDCLEVTRSQAKASIRRGHLSDKAQAIPEARLKRFDGDFLFPQNDVDGSSPVKALDIVHRSVVRKLEYNFRLYDCRRIFATRALESRTDPITLAAILGHANLRTVSRYAQPSEERKAEAIRRMQKPKPKQSNRGK